MATTTENSTGFMTFQATAAAIAQAIRVKVDSNGQISAAAATDAAVGVTTEAVAASGWGTVKLFSAPGTFLVTAGAAITRGTQLYPLAAGKVDDAGTTALPLIALEAALADGDIIAAGRALKGA
ncbi:MAG: hypothetical protein JNK85_05500 [Verrucomicrobiales bacterium]|nr:hypothetical protein [Verrucomicrobiales bacterium]